MLRLLKYSSIIQYKYAHSYAQEHNTLIHIFKYSSAVIVLGVRLTKHQHIHLDIQPAKQQMFTSLFTYR